MDRFEVMVGLLRRGLSERAAQVRGEEPGAWLPRWTAGEPLSRAMRQMHQLGSLIEAVRLDDTYAWAFICGRVHRITIADGEVHRLDLEGPHESYRDAVFDGDTVAAISDDQLLVWDLTNGRRLLATDPDDIPRPAGGLRSLTIGAGVAVTGTEHGYLLQWDLHDGSRLAKTAAHDGYIAGVAISTDGPPTVLSIGGENHSTVCFHDLGGLRRTGKAAMPGPLCGGGWTTLDRQRLAVTVSEDGLLSVWDPATAVPLGQSPAADRPTGALAFTSDGARAVLGDGQLLQVVDLRDGTVHGTIRTDFEYNIDHVAVCGPLAFAGQDGSSEGRTNLLELADPLPHDARYRPHFQDAAMSTVDGRPAVVTVDLGGLFRVFDATDGRQLGEPPVEPLDERRTVGSRRELAATTADGRDLVVSMFDLVPTSLGPATDEIRTVPQPSTTGPVLRATAAHDGLVAAVDVGGTLAIWDAATLTLRASTCVAKPNEIMTIALGELHGRTVVLTGAHDGGIRWFDAADLTEIPAPGRFTERRSPTDSVVNMLRWPGLDAVTALHVAGTMVVSAVANTVTYADIATGEPVGPQLVHPGNVEAVLPAVLDAVPVVATSCADRVLRIWEIGTGRVTLTVTLPRPVHRIVAITAEQFIVLDNGCLIAADAASGTRPTVVPVASTLSQDTAGGTTRS